MTKYKYTGLVLGWYLHRNIEMWFEFDLSLYVIQSYISIYHTRKLLRNLFLQQKISKIRESKAAPRIYTDNEKLGDTRKIAYLQQVILENEVDDKKKRK